MNREELDAFFAHADDVLTDWTGSTDAMRVRHDEPEALPLADSYYDQDFDSELRGFIAASERAGEALTRFADAWRQVAQRYGEALSGIRVSATAVVLTPKDLDPMLRALEARRNRNTGPSTRVGLDGHYRRQR